MAWLLKETELNTFAAKNMVLPSPGEAGEAGEAGEGAVFTHEKIPGQLFSSRSCSYLCPSVHRRRIVGS